MLPDNQLWLGMERTHGQSDWRLSCLALMKEGDRLNTPVITSCKLEHNENRLAFLKAIQDRQSGGYPASDLVINSSVLEGAG